MKLFKKISKFASKSQESILGKILIKANLIIFHWDGRRRLIHPGNDDPDITYYVIRPRGITEGLLSSWFGVLDNIVWAMNKGYIPYVDFSECNRKYCQYYVNREIHGSRNAWEYYFNQPSNLTREEIFNKKNVILSGWTLKAFEVQKNCQEDEYYAHLISEKNYITNIVDNQEGALFSNSKVLGVFIRGTDYVSLKPKNHPKQPSIEEMISKIKLIIKEQQIEKIYVVTEDKTYFKMFKEKFGDKIISIFDTYTEYKEGEYLQKLYNDDPYERGLQYLIRILLLSRCKFWVCSKASGSMFAKTIRKKKPEFEYWFDLGNY